jgi:hypothetical protein
MRGVQRQASSDKCGYGGVLRHTDNPNVCENEGRRGDRKRRNQIRANNFRQRTEANNLIQLIDGHKDDMLVEGEGQLSTKQHELVVTRIYDKSSRITSTCLKETQSRTYGKRTLWGDTRTRTRQEEPSFSLHNLQQASVREQIECQHVTSEHLEIHGMAPGSKPDGVCRILYNNMNGIDYQNMFHPKIVKARCIHDELEADIVAYNKHRLNLCHKDNQMGFNQLFRSGEAEIKSVVAHNEHENVGRIQEGGTAVMVFGPMTQHTDLSPGKDGTGLGRWVVIPLRRMGGFVTRVVCGYNLCGNALPHLGTVYQQHWRLLITRQHSMVCPRVKFRENLLAQLTTWREQGDQIIVCLDANEDIYKKSLGKALTSEAGLAMKEVVGL